MSWLASLIPMNGYGHYISWHFIQVSVANLVIIILMVVTFITALLVPFPGRARRKGNK